MNLKLSNQQFLIGGASSGFGRAIAESLLEEGAKVIAIARKEEALREFQALKKGQLEVFTGDLTSPETLEKLKKTFDYSKLSGVVINAGGPPAGNFMEVPIEDWDSAYKQLIRWKVQLTKDLIPYMKNNHYGRFLYIESVSVKQPIENLVLSNSLRMAVVGFVKSLSADFASSGITFNILAPGYHETQAIDRLLKKASEMKGMSEKEAKENIIQNIPAGLMGKTHDFASLATWLLSGSSAYISGQTISVDGGVVKGVFG